MWPQMQTRKWKEQQTLGSAQKFVFRVLCTAVLILCNYARSIFWAYARLSVGHVPSHAQNVPDRVKTGKNSTVLNELVPLELAETRARMLHKRIISAPVKINIR
jgi:hypothetical protein